MRVCQKTAACDLQCVASHAPVRHHLSSLKKLFKIQTILHNNNKKNYTPVCLCVLERKISTSWFERKKKKKQIVELYTHFKMVIYLLFTFVRVLEQHKLSKEQWEERIQVWHEEHHGMLR